MSDSPERHFVDCVCSRTGKTWYAVIEMFGSNWRFVDHYLPERYMAFQQEAKREARRQEILRRMNALSQGSGPVLPPPPQTEMKPVFQDADISAASISPFGFECPYCKEGIPLYCVVCHAYSCMGEVDSNRRTICVRCGITLQFSDSSNAGDSAYPPMPLKTQTPGLKASENALPNISQRKLLPGHEE